MTWKSWVLFPFGKHKAFFRLKKLTFVPPEKRGKFKNSPLSFIFQFEKRSPEKLTASGDLNLVNGSEGSSGLVFVREELMKKTILAAILAVGSVASGMVEAGVLRFDVSGVTSSQGSLLGTFELDTATQDVSNISVTGISGLGSVAYSSGLGGFGRVFRDGTSPAPFDFATLELFTDPSFTTVVRLDIAGFNTVMPGLAVGDNITTAVSGIEIVAGVGSRAFSTSSIGITRLPDVVVGPGPSTVPLPAGLPLVLAGIGVFGVLRRKSKG